MNRLVFLVEELSMKALLDGLLPRLWPELNFLCVPHEGKQDLEKSIPRKLRAWQEPGVRFIVVRDNDGADCRAVKQKLLELCATGGRTDALVRIACQELEAWYFGDLEALSLAFEKEELRELGSKERFRDPDAIVNPATVLAELIPAFQKISGARRMAERLQPARTRSRSFRALLEAIQRLSGASPVV